MSLEPGEKAKAHIVMALLSQETAKAAFDGQFTALDPHNIMPPVSLPTDTAADQREIAVTLDDDGRLTVKFDSRQYPQFLLADLGDGKPVKEALGAGSQVEANMAFTLKADEFDRLAQLDYTEFDDTQAESINADTHCAEQDPHRRGLLCARFPLRGRPLLAQRQPPVHPQLSGRWRPMLCPRPSPSGIPRDASRHCGTDRCQKKETCAMPPAGRRARTRRRRSRGRLGAERADSADGEVGAGGEAANAGRCGRNPAGMRRIRSASR